MIVSGIDKLLLYKILNISSLRALFFQFTELWIIILTYSSRIVLLVNKKPPRKRIILPQFVLEIEENKNLTLLAIAFDAGFSSKTAFNTFFKKYSGMTPSEFKNKS